VQFWRSLNANFARQNFGAKVFQFLPIFAKKKNLAMTKNEERKKRIKITFSFHEGNWFNPFNPTFILIQKYLKATHYEKKSNISKNHSGHHSFERFFNRLLLCTVIVTYYF